MAKIAIIEAGGKQHVVAQDSVIKVEKIAAKGTLKPGDAITFDKVLFVDDGISANMGAPYVSGASVMGELIEEGRNQTVTVIKYRQKSRYFKKRGHRQHFAKVKITKLP